MNTTCPTCQEQLSVKVSLHENGSYTTYVTAGDSPTTVLRNSLLRYWRWVAEGKLKYQGSWNGKEKRQYYYDGYHNSIGYDQETELYSFSIQMTDSPEGDTWWSGTFKVERGMDIVDVKSETSHH
jgi:hypothetical protein